MADRAIVAADVFAQIIRVVDYATGDSAKNPPKRQVDLVLQITPDATNPAVLYPAGNIPLTNLFTAGNASDTGLDASQPIHALCQPFHLSAGTTPPVAGTPALEARFVSVGTTAATKLLMLFRGNAVLGGARVASYSAGTISAASADSSINDTANGFPAYVAGDLIMISGFTGTTANNQIVQVVSRTASKVITSNAIPFVNDLAGETVTITCLSRAGAGFVRLDDNEDISGPQLLGADTPMMTRMSLVGNRRPGLIGNAT